MARQIIETHTCDVCGDKIGEASALPKAKQIGLRVSEIELEESGTTVTDLYSFEEACDTSRGEVKALFAKLTKKKEPKAPRARKAKPAAASAAPADGEAPKRKRGRPKKVQETPAPASEVSVSNGAASSF